MCIGMRTYICIDVYIEMFREMRVGMCIQMCIDMCIDMCLDTCRQNAAQTAGVCVRDVNRHACRHVDRHACRHVDRHACRHVDRHACRHVDTYARGQAFREIICDRYTYYIMVELLSLICRSAPDDEPEEQHSHKIKELEVDA